MGFQFSQEELAVLRECDIEAMFQRSFPLGTGFGLATWAACQRGFFSVSPRFGAAPKVFGAVIFGYFLGKLSYQSKCAEKIMKLPNSRLAEALRRRKKGEFFENFTGDGAMSLAPFSSATDVYTDENMKSASKQENSLDFDVDRRTWSDGLDDTQRPSIDTPDRNFNDNLPLEPPKSSATYEELRRKNRDDYDKRMQAPFASRSLNRDEAPLVNRSPPERDESFQQGGAKNKYGDVWK